jgi:hypothetical protein
MMNNNPNMGNNMGGLNAGTGINSMGGGMPQQQQ